MHWHINFASALLGNSILCSLPRYTTVIDSSSSLVFSFSCCTCCLFIFVLVFVMFSLIMLKLFWTVILKCLCGTVPITEDRSWRIHDAYLTPKGLDTTRPKMTDFALTVESSHRKSHFPRRYPDTFLFSPGDVNRLSVYLASVKKKNDCLRLRKRQLQILSGRREGASLNFCWYLILGEDRLSSEINTSPSLCHLRRTDTFDWRNEREFSRVMIEYIRDLWRVSSELPF